MKKNLFWKLRNAVVPLFSIGLLIGGSSTALALTDISAKVVHVEATYMPGAVTFVLDTGNSTCPAGTWVTWQKDVDNNKAVYTLLIAAVTSGRRIEFFINDGDTTCKGQFIHLTNG